MEKRKNIHLLATDKGQRITKTSKGTLLWCSKSAEDFIETRKGYLGFHLYITNDEEIKEGDWCYDVALKVFQASHNFNGYNNNLCKKIILTTDQDLIKDNVQAIDNEFLEWFVKNPSCEEIKVADYGNILFDDKVFYMYKIIIPKEEPKQDLEKEMFELEEQLDIPSHLRWHNSKPKQETIEEATERLRKDKYGIFISKDANVKGQLVIDTANAAFLSGMNEGAKWQTEQNNTSKINRVEVIQHSEPYNGRAYTNYNAKDVEIQFQDDGKTLKIFLK